MGQLGPGAQLWVRKRSADKVTVSVSLVTLRTIVDFRNSRRTLYRARNLRNSGPKS